jgi:hypothetical protein
MSYLKKGYDVKNFAKAIPTREHKNPLKEITSKNKKTIAAFIFSNFAFFKSKKFHILKTLGGKFERK